MVNTKGIRQIDIPIDLIKQKKVDTGIFEMFDKTINQVPNNVIPSEL